VRIDAIVLTCEHGGNRVPARHARLFASARARAALSSHRGLDIGALRVARFLERRLRAPLIHSTVTRLLVELNRSIGHRELFSEFSARLSGAERERILRRHYRPYRDRVRAEIARQAGGGRRTLHVAVHSFTPRLHGHTRTADVALLYDPRRRDEVRLCVLWKAALEELQPELRVRRNYPYRGEDDGFTTVLRRDFGRRRYLGIELEVNQALLAGPAAARDRVTRTIAESLIRLRNN
jgi:predicted N-formylglutamate amidohydrolase